jgi:hypothetical protein
MTTFTKTNTQSPLHFPIHLPYPKTQILYTSQTPNFPALVSRLSRSLTLSHILSPHINFFHTRSRITIQSINPPEKKFPNKKEIAKKISNSKKKNAMPVPTSATKPNTKQNKTNRNQRIEEGIEEDEEDWRRRKSNTNQRTKRAETNKGETSKPKCAVQRVPNGRWRSL